MSAKKKRAFADDSEFNKIHSSASKQTPQKTSTGSKTYSYPLLAAVVLREQKVQLKLCDDDIALECTNGSCILRCRPELLDKYQKSVDFACNPKRMCTLNRRSWISPNVVAILILKENNNINHKYVLFFENNVGGRFLQHVGGTVTSQTNGSLISILRGLPELKGLFTKSPRNTEIIDLQLANSQKVIIKRFANAKVYVAEEQYCFEHLDTKILVRVEHVAKITVAAVDDRSKRVPVEFTVTGLEDIAYIGFAICGVSPYINGKLNTSKFESIFSRHLVTPLTSGTVSYPYKFPKSTLALEDKDKVPQNEKILEGIISTKTKIPVPPKSCLTFLQKDARKAPNISLFSDLAKEIEVTSDTNTNRVSTKIVRPTALTKPSALSFPVEKGKERKTKSPKPSTGLPSPKRRKYHFEDDQNTLPKADLERILFYYPDCGSIDTVTIRGTDRAHCAWGEYLNDSIIDFWAKRQLQEYCKPSTQQRLHLTSSYFFSRMDHRIRNQRKTIFSDYSPKAMKQKFEAFQRVRTWCRGVDIFKRHFIVIPINKMEHWSLAIVRFEHNDASEVPEATIMTMDSLGNLHVPEYTACIVRMYLNHEWVARKRALRQGKEWPLPPRHKQTDEDVNDNSEDGCISEDEVESDSEVEIVENPGLQDSSDLDTFSVSKDQEVFSKENCLVKKIKAPLQADGFNCGVYVLKNIEVFFSLCDEEDGGDIVAPSVSTILNRFTMFEFNSKQAREYRYSIRSTIDELTQKYIAKSKSA